MGKFILKLLGCALLTWLMYLLGQVFIAKTYALPLALAASSVFWGKLMARYVIEIIPAIKRKAERDVLEPLNGRYYAYDNLRIRLFLIEGVIWVPEQDLAPIIRPLPDSRELRLLGEDYATIPLQKFKGFTERGLLRMMTIRTNTRGASFAMLRFKRWLETEALPNLKRFPVSASD